MRSWSALTCTLYLLSLSCGLSELDGLSRGPNSAPIADAADEAEIADAGDGGETDDPDRGDTEESLDSRDEVGDGSMATSAPDGAACGCDGDACKYTPDDSGACTCALGWTGESCDTTGLGLYWKFDETSGTIAVDSSGNNLTGQYLSTTSELPLPAPGAVPASMAQWDPASLSFRRDATLRHAVKISSAEAGPGFALLRPLNDMTISLWYRTAIADLDEAGAELVSLGDHYILRLGLSAPQAKYRLEFNKYVSKGATNGHVQCLYTFPMSSTPPFLDGHWHHVAAVSSRVAPGLAIYLDGVLVPCDQILNGAFITGDIVYEGLGRDFFVGRHGYEPNGENFHDYQGNVDELRFYNRVLSHQEIEALARGVRLPPG